MILFYKPALERLGIEVDDPHRRFLAIPEPHARPRLRRHRQAAGPNRSRPATSSATSSARSRPTAKARAIIGGIKNPAVDALIERVIFAKDRDELVAATQGARPRAAVEPLRGADLDHRLSRAPPAGIGSASRKSCRPIPSASPTSGGTTASARPRSEAANEPPPPRTFTPPGARDRSRRSRGRFRSRLSVGAQETESHGISAFGDLKYPPDFKHFAYVNPDAPKGGAFSQIGPTRQFNQSFLTFNSLNAYVLRGDAAQGMEFTFAALMGPSSLTMPGHDEPDAMYGYAARAVRISADGRTYRFLMRPEARFHDGSRLTAHDAAFSLGILKEKGHPIIRQLMRDMEGVEAAGEDVAGRAFRREARAGDSAARRGFADFLARLLRQQELRGIDARDSARLRPLQGRPLRGRALHRIRPREGLVGRQSAAESRQVQFRYGSLRVFSRPRRRLRGLHRQELSVPRGIHLAHLGDALRFPRLQGRPRQARDPARSDALRRPGLVPQYAAREIQGSARARGDRARLRFRVDQQERDVRLLRPHPLLFPEFRPDGDGQAFRRGTCDAWSRSAARCPTKSSASPSSRRSPTAPARIARSCAAPRIFCVPPATTSSTASA